MLEQAAWDALTAGKLSGATDAFRQALEREPKNARWHLGAGTAAYLERRYPDALSHAQRALSIDPRLTRARALLGQAMRRTGDLHGAIREFEMVVIELPNDAD